MLGRKTFSNLFATGIALAALALLAACGPRATVTPAPAGPTFAAGAEEANNEESPEDVAEPDRAVRFHDQIVLPWVDPAEHSGEIRLATTPSMQPLATAMADRFQFEGFNGQIRLETGTPADGVKAFCLLKRADALLIARPLTPAEKEKCAQNGAPLLEMRVGLDAIAVVVSEKNAFAQDLTLDELRKAFSTALTWQDLRPGWPAQPVLRLSPASESDTFAAFAQKVFNGNAQPLLSASRLTFVDDPQALMKQVSASPYAIGLVGLSLLQESPSQVRALDLNHISPWDAGEGTDYPLLRPVMLYTTAQTLKSKPHVAAFLNYFLTNIGEGLNEAGEFPLSTQELNQAKAVWLKALGYRVP